MTEKQELKEYIKLIFYGIVFYMFFFFFAIATILVALSAKPDRSGLLTAFILAVITVFVGFLTNMRIDKIERASKENES